MDEGGCEEFGLPHTLLYLLEILVFQRRVLFESDGLKELFEVILFKVGSFVVGVKELVLDPGC